MTRTADVVLREMRWWDIEPVLGLEQVLFPEDAWTAGMFWSELAHARGPGATRRYVVADAGAGAAAGAGTGGTGGTVDHGSLVGYGGLAAVAGTADIQTVGVVPEHRGTGLAARLMRELLGAAGDFDCHEVLLEVRVDNVPARRLYERFGFTGIGVRRGYYQPGAVDALVMRRDLSDHGSAPSTATDPSYVPQGTKTHG